MTPSSPNAVTVGVFDGVHRGHQKVFSVLLRIAREEGLTPAVLTFSPHPRMKSIMEEGGLLISEEERENMIRSFGISEVSFLDFDSTVKNMSPEDFFHDIILGRFSAHAVVVGSTHRFGRAGEGDPELLSELCRKEGIRFREVPPLIADGKAVSSQRIRELLSVGSIKQANILLGRSYRITGRVVRGTGIGATMVGYPTANVDPEPPERLIPASGVYGITVSCHEEDFWGVANIGRAPTLRDIHGRSDTRLEVHVVDWNGDLYGKDLCVDFHVRLRDEYHFDTIDGLNKQILKDVGRARHLMRSEISGIVRSDTAGNATLP